jgi:hypothetical protein
MFPRRSSDEDQAARLLRQGGSVNKPVAMQYLVRHVWLSH